MEASGLDPRLFQALLLMTIFTLPIKGLALWRAAQNNQKGWYIALLLINGLGILELAYLFYFSKPKSGSKEEA